jgi:hypothetical protein
LIAGHVKGGVTLVSAWRRALLVIAVFALGLFQQAHAHKNGRSAARLEATESNAAPNPVKVQSTIEQRFLVHMDFGLQGSCAGSTHSVGDGTNPECVGTAEGL